MDTCNPRSPPTALQPKEDRTTHGIPVARQYAVPVASRYGTLSNRQESQEPSDTIFPTNSEQSSKLVPGFTHKYPKGLHRKKIPAMNQHRRLMSHQPNKSNLQQPNINEDREYGIPTIVNGVTNENPTSGNVQKHSDLIKTHINNLRESINVHNREKCLLSKNIE
jgi:hypothetical protein